ncbi:MAG: type II toxin-antitoxin system RelE/ParE family toxin [Thermoplasmata archaeon]|nr:MAG: type II toxin-antitoxin system RelE/ParE family toxin [Thermoplasmata archaeon]
MNWKISYSKSALKFIEKHNIKVEVKEEIRKFLLLLKRENVNVDVKKLYGDWKGYYRIRKGKLRIIFSLNKLEKEIYIEKIDFRGDVYK